MARAAHHSRHWRAAAHFLWVNPLRLRQNGHHFPGDIFKCIFSNWVLINISLKFVPKGQINNIPALVQIMAWHRPGHKPLSALMKVNLLIHICITQPQWVNTLRPIQNGDYIFDIYKLNFLYENCCILIQIPPKFVHWGPVIWSMWFIKAKDTNACVFTMELLLFYS